MNKYLLVSLSTLCTAFATYHLFLKNKAKKDVLTFDETLEIYESLFLSFKENSKQISRKDSYGEPHPREYIDSQYTALYPKVEAAVHAKYEVKGPKFEDSLHYYRDDPRIKQLNRKFIILKKTIFNDEVTEYNFPESMKPSTIIHILDSMKSKIEEILNNIVISLKERGFSLVDVDIDEFDPITNFFFIFRERYERESLINILKCDGYTIENYYDAIELYSYQDDFSNMLKQEVSEYEKSFDSHFGEAKFSEVTLPDTLTPDKVLEIFQKITNSYETTMGSAIKRLLKEKSLTKEDILSRIAQSDKSIVDLLSLYINKEPYFDEDEFEVKYGFPLQLYFAALTQYRKNDDFTVKFRSIDKQKAEIIQIYISRFLLGE